LSDSSLNTLAGRWQFKPGLLNVLFLFFFPLYLCSF